MQRTREELKQLLQDNACITEETLYDLIDSVFNLTDDMFPGGTGTLDSYSITSSRNRKNVSNLYLQGGGGVFTNVSPHVIIKDGYINGIAMISKNPSTWNAVIYKNGVLATTLSCTNELFNKNEALNIAVTKDDKISMYCSGSQIDRPKITLWITNTGN